MEMSIYCCTCQQNVTAGLCTVAQVYPHRSDFAALPFWVCPHCKNFVGCHHKTQDRTRPLGVIPSAEIRKARQHIHRALDPIWKSGSIPRKSLYRRLANTLGLKEYHTAEIKTIEDARTVYRAVLAIRKELEITNG